MSEGAPAAPLLPLFAEKWGNFLRRVGHPLVEQVPNAAPLLHELSQRDAPSVLATLLVYAPLVRPLIADRNLPALIDFALAIAADTEYTHTVTQVADLIDLPLFWRYADFFLSVIDDINSNGGDREV